MLALTGSQLGRLFPAKIEFNSTDRTGKVRIVGVAAGCYHSLALYDDGSDLIEFLSSMKMVKIDSPSVVHINDAVDLSSFNRSSEINFSTARKVSRTVSNEDTIWGG